ncbi:hypothetical protein G6L37_04005 [Agrobacterium rubi]|nr:hypothetical protein [Agrobacterium rubi]NTF24514.1 hypothetical protein [Agrobacterium rubi]
MAPLSRRRAAAPVSEGPTDEELYGGGGGDIVDAPDETQPATPSETVAANDEPDEFDIAAAVVKDSTGDVPVSSDAASTPVADDAAADGEAPPADPEEDAEKSKDQAILEDYQRTTGATPEQAKAWLEAAKAARAQQNPAEQRQDPEQKQDPRLQPRPGAPSALGALFSGVGGLGGSALRGLKNGAVTTTNAALRGTGLKASAGLTPEVVRNRLFNKWHEDYEIGKRGLERSTGDIIKMAAAYNQLIRTGAPGRELEKIAKSQGTDIKTLISDVTAGKVQDNDAKAAVEALRTDPHVQKAWTNFSNSVSAYGGHLEAVQHNLTQLATNRSDKINLEVEHAALGEIVGKHSKVEKPFELPANPIGDEKKADGKSPQKSVWEQFMEMSQNGLNFLQNLMERVATFVASKLGR